MIPFYKVAFKQRGAWRRIKRNKRDAAGAVSAAKADCIEIKASRITGIERYVFTMVPSVKNSGRRQGAHG